MLHILDVFYNYLKEKMTKSELSYTIFRIQTAETVQTNYTRNCCWWVNSDKQTNKQKNSTYNKASKCARKNEPEIEGLVSNFYKEPKR